MLVFDESPEEAVNAVATQTLLTYSRRTASLALAESRFLRALPGDLLDSMAGDLEAVDLKRGDVLLKAGELIEFVYFPTTCLVSMIVSLENGNTIEATTIGSNGFSGISVYLGRDTAAATCITQVAGEALRMRAAAFRRHLEDVRLRDHIGRYAAKILINIAQSTACIAFHPVPERLARWLLMVRDGLDEDEFLLTQDFLAVMLGVHRPTVTVAIRSLAAAGLVEHQRGRIRILDPDALMEAACECYRLPGASWAEA
jgi:CRP-like cAMP-binding protein